MTLETGARAPRERLGTRDGPEGRNPPQTRSPAGGQLLSDSEAEATQVPRPPPTTAQCHYRPQPHSTPNHLGQRAHARTERGRSQAGSGHERVAIGVGVTFGGCSWH